MEFLTRSIAVSAAGDPENVPAPVTEEDEKMVSTEPIDDPDIMNQLIKPHLQKAVDDGFMDVDEDEDEDEIILFKEPILTALTPEMRGNEFKVCAVDYQMSDEPDGTDIVRLHTDESSLPELTGDALRRFKEVTEPVQVSGAAPKPEEPTAKKTVTFSPSTKRTSADDQAEEPAPKSSKKTDEQQTVRPAGAEASASAPKSQPPPLPGPKEAASPKIKAKPRPKPTDQPQPNVLGNPYLGEPGEIVVCPTKDLPGVKHMSLSSDQQWISKRVTSLLRGWEHIAKNNRVEPPPFLPGLWMDFTSVYRYVKKKFVARLTLEELILVVVNNHRFMVEVKIPPEGTLVAGKYGFTPIKLKAIANHNHWATRNVENAMPEITRLITLDPQFTQECFIDGKFPQVPVNSIIKVMDVEPSIVYHYTHNAVMMDIINMGILPGGLKAANKYSFLSKEDPWSISDTQFASMAATRPLCFALDFRLMIAEGLRIVETTAGAILCADWIPNQFVIYGFDMSSGSFVYANHIYADERSRYNDRVSQFRKDRSGGPLAGDDGLQNSTFFTLLLSVMSDYKRWCGFVKTDRPYYYEDPIPLMNVKDQMRTGPNNPDLDVLIQSYVARKPFGNAPWNQMSPMIMEDYEDYRRFNTRSFDPHNEGLGKTLWAVVEQRLMPERQCQQCKHLYTFGMLACVNCGAYLHLSSDLGKAAQVIRIEEIATSLGIDVSLDMVPDDELRGSGERLTPAGTPGHEIARASRSGLTILKNNAKSHVKKAERMSVTVMQRQLIDPFYAFNCAAQDLTPLCLGFIDKLANAVVPDPPRTREMIMKGEGHRYAGKIVYIADPNIVGESDLSREFFVYWRNRFHRPEVFATLYADSYKRPPICGFGDEWKSDLEDPQDILDDLLAFMAEDFERIPGNALTIGKEQRSMIIPQTKAGSTAAKSFAQRQSQHSAYQHDTRWESRGYGSRDQPSSSQSWWSSDWWHSDDRSWRDSDWSRGGWGNHDWNQRRGW